jgi:hypothetical protein
MGHTCELHVGDPETGFCGLRAAYLKGAPLDSILALLSSTVSSHGEAAEEYWFLRGGGLQQQFGRPVVRAQPGQPLKERCAETRAERETNAERGDRRQAKRERGIDPRRARTLWKCHPTNGFQVFSKKNCLPGWNVHHNGIKRVL